MARLEKEAEEQSLMRMNIQKESKESEEKINEDDIEKEAKKYEKRKKNGRETFSQRKKTRNGRRRIKITLLSKLTKNWNKFPVRPEK